MRVLMAMLALARSCPPLRQPIALESADITAEAGGDGPRLALQSNDKEGPCSITRSCS